MHELNIGGSNMTVELDGTTIAATSNTGNKQWLAVITDTHPKYNYDRDFVAYQQPKTTNRDSGTATVEEGAVLERVRYTHSGKNRSDSYYQLVDGEAHQIEEGEVTAALGGEIVADVESESHECEECGDEFDSEHGLAVHQGIKHSDDEETESNTEEPTMTESNTGDTNAEAMTDGGQTAVGCDLTVESEPVVEVAVAGYCKIDVRTEGGFTFRFTIDGDGDCRFGDGYLPGEDPSTLDPSRAWVFGTDEVPDHIVVALSDAGYEYAGESATPRALLTTDGEDETWRDRAARYATVEVEVSSNASDDSHDGDEDLVTDGGTEEIRDSREVRDSDDEVRHYSADGHLYAYREGDEHVVVSRGNEPRTRWTERVPAEREAVISGEHLWTIPENWECRVNIKGAAEARYAIYYIPETGVDVLVSVPHKNYLVDAWYGVQRVGELTVSYDDECSWSELERAIEAVRDIEEVSDDVPEALESLHRRRRSFERKFAEGVDMYAEEALFERAHEPVSVNGWTTDPWGDIFRVDDLVGDFLGVDGETHDAVMRELSEANVIPRYPTVRVDVDADAPTPEGYDIRALVEAGASGAETIDYLVTEHYGLMTQTDWAAVRGKGASAISKNVSGAKAELSE